jgi:hypothetical protein
VGNSVNDSQSPSTAPPRFSCPACGKRFTWRDEYAGRKVNCKCGAVFLAQLGGTTLLDQTVRMTDADEIRPVLPNAPQTSVRMPAGYAIPRVRRAAHDMATDDDDASPFRDLYIPGVLLAIGAVARVVQTIQFTSSHSLTVGHAIGLLACEIIICGAAMVGGVMIAAQILGTTFGSPGPAVLKLAAIALSVTAAGYLLASIDHEPGSPRGAILAWHLVLILNFVLFVWLFKLELSEGMVVVVIVMLVRLILQFAASRGATRDIAQWLMFGGN